MEVEEKETSVSIGDLKKKGRGLTEANNVPDVVSGGSDWYDKLYKSGGKVGDNSQRSIEGWLIMVTGIHEEASEEDVSDFFGEYGEIKNISLPLDRRTGYVKGYAIIEYATRSEAIKSIEGSSGEELLGKKLESDFAIISQPPDIAKSQPTRRRSASPERS